MTDLAIQSQIATIKSATQKALASKESATKFLMDAGILKTTAKKDLKKKSK
jgi:hypothetical protein